MVLITQSGPETLSIGAEAPDFPPLTGVDGRSWNLASFRDARGIVLCFTCNHCPYAKAYEDRFAALARDYPTRGIAFLAVNSNDASAYPDDSFENMQRRAREKNFPFPYVQDRTQAVARAYGAVCTPHIFLLDGRRRLAYEGRIDDNWKEPGLVKRSDLREAIDDLLAGQPVRTPRTNPMGCSLKWK